MPALSLDPVGLWECERNKNKKQEYKLIIVESFKVRSLHILFFQI